MKNTKYNKTISLVCVLLISTTSLVWANTQDIIGSWMGTLRIGDMELRMAYTIEEDPNGSLSAALHSVDEVVYDIPVNEIKYEDNQLRRDTQAEPSPGSEAPFSI
jgi:hypothetical protein